MLRCALVLLLTTFASGALAQVQWRSHLDGPSLSYDAAYGAPNTFQRVPCDRCKTSRKEHVSYYGALLSARVPIGEDVTLVGSLPFTLLGVRYPDSQVAEDELGGTFSNLGNLYLGVAAQPLAGGEVEAGVWLSPRDAYGEDVGLSTDRENLEAYKRNVIAARLAVRGEVDLAPTVRLRGEVAPIVSYRTGSRARTPRATGAATATAFADVRLNDFTLSGGATGRYEPNGTEWNSEEVWVSGLGVLAYEGSAVRPSVGVRVPLASTSVSSFALHAGLSVPIR